MIARLGWVVELANRHAGMLLALGLVALAAFNASRWRDDQKRLASRSQPEPIPPPEAWPVQPEVTVLVAAWNEATSIDRHIQSFRGLRYAKKQLVLCAGGADGTFALASRWAGPDVIVLEQRRGEGKQAALRRSLAWANGEVVYLTDADCRLDSRSFETLLYRLLVGAETAATGTSRPLSEQLATPFVRHQWATVRYLDALASAFYTSGLLGRNALVRRDALEAAWQEERKVPTGTDYYLALRLRQAGQRIRRVSDSSVETAYPESVPTYVHQQSRWLRSLFLLGYQYRDRHHVQHAVQTSLLGLTMLTIPTLPLVIGRSGLVLWLLSWIAVASARLRYAAVASQLEDKPPRSAISLALLTVMLADFVAWSRVLPDVCWARGRQRW